MPHGVNAETPGSSFPQGSNYRAHPWLQAAEAAHLVVPTLRQGRGLRLIGQDWAGAGDRGAFFLFGFGH